MVGRLKKEFFQRDVLVVAPQLLGKKLVRMVSENEIIEDIITETEAYGGEEDLASHARFGKTKRNTLMYEGGGVVYVYLIYGMYCMLNIITSTKNKPQGVLIRSLKNTEGSGRVGRVLKLDKSFYGEDLCKSSRIWIEDSNYRNFKIEERTRVGVDYAGEWAKKKWRFVLVENK